MALTAEELANYAKTVAAIGGILAALWAILSRWVRRRRKANEMRRLEARATRYLLDAVRHTLAAVKGDRSYVIGPKELDRQKVLIDAIRDELWVADGHTSEREAQRQLQGVVEVLTRTQAIHLKEQRPSTPEEKPE